MTPLSRYTEPQKRNDGQVQQPQRQRNQRGEGGRLREDLMLAAMRILDRAPAAQLSLRMIAREAGIAAPSVYAHFESAENMIETIVRECWRQMGEEMLKGSDAGGVGGAFAILEGQMSAFVRYAMERPSRYQLLFAMQMDSDAWRDLSGPVQPAYRPVFETIERLAAEGVSLPMPDAQSAAILTLSVAHGRIALAHLAPRRPGNGAGGVESFVREALKGMFKSEAISKSVEPAPKRPLTARRKAPANRSKSAPGSK